MRCEDIFEAGHDLGVTSTGSPAHPGAGGGQAVDQSMEQILLQRPRNLPIRDHVGLGLGKTADFPM